MLSEYDLAQHALGLTLVVNRDKDPQTGLGGSAMSKHKTRQIARITNAALALISEEGLSRLNISKVADGAGVTRQTVYKYFPDVGSIITAALEEHGKAMEQHLLKIISEAVTPREKLLAFARFQILSASSHHENVSLEAALPMESRQRLEQHLVSVKRVLRRTIEDGKKSGDFASQTDPVIAGELIWNIAKGFADTTARHPDKKTDLLETVEKAILAIL